MTHLNKLKILKWVSSNFVGGHQNPSSSVGSLLYVAANPRFYRTKRIVLDENGEIMDPILDPTRKEAQAALLEYFHYTRNLQFTTAENMSKNSPLFLERLLEKVDIDADIGRSVARFLHFHPINEYEPFFESLGLKPHEYSHLLPCDLMFLCDDELLLENYYVLRNYGVARSKIGMLYKEAKEIFQHDYGVLLLKLKSYEEFGLRQSFVIKLLICSPYLLIGEVNADFIKVLEILRKAGVEVGRIEKHLSEKRFYNWSKLLPLLNLFRHTGYNEEQLGGMMSQHLSIWFGDSLDRIHLLIGFLIKFGSTAKQICSMFLQFPQLRFAKFVSNLRHSYLFLNEMKMARNEIGDIFSSHTAMLGSIRLKRASTLIRSLNAGTKQICEVIQENPQVLRKWVMGSKVEQLPNILRESRRLKIEFLLDLGIIENDKVERALKIFQCSGRKIQERFDCLVEAGLDRKDVCAMIRKNPRILNQRKDALEMKIGFFINDLGFPISCLVDSPSYFSHSMHKVKLRLAMCNWLKDHGKLEYMIALNTILGFSDADFIKIFVNRHPEGPEIWQELMKKNYSEQKATRS